MIDKIKNRLASEEGFTLIELLVVIIILGILVAIAVPSYLSFRGKAEGAAAAANVRSAIPAAESFYQNADPTNTYTGITGVALRSQAPGIAQNVLAAATTNGQGYCIQDTQGGSTYYYEGGANGDAVVQVVDDTHAGCPSDYSVGDSFTPPVTP